jgi:hypothetical protein
VKPSLAPVLTLHRGGADPVEQARLVNEAQRALRALADALPASDRLRYPVGKLADALGILRIPEDVNGPGSGPPDD